MQQVDFRDIYQRCDLPDGKEAILVLHPKFTKLDINRNLFLRDAKGTIIWQVSSDYDDNASGPFVLIRYLEGRLQASRWNGLLYEIDIKSGHGFVIAETR